MYAMYGNMDPINIGPHVSIYTIHGSYGYGIILPIDELIFFKMVIAPPTR